jgi:ADP-heptose:LPS heptosyltransferase
LAVRTSFLKSLDRALHPLACAVASILPKSPSAPVRKTLILRPGGLGDLICADIALQELSLDARDFTWLIERRSQPWAEFRGLPHFCYEARPGKTLREVRGNFSLIINTEQRFGLAEAYALAVRTRNSRVISFETNRGARWSDATVAYDWKDAHETVEFARLFASALGKSAPAPQPRSRPRLVPPGVPPMVVVAGRQSPSRHLDLDAWTEQIVRWHQGRAFQIASAPEDAAFAMQLAKRFENLGHLFQGSFPELCGQISRSEEMLTMDGGALHIASYFGVPTLALFSSGRDRKWHPLGEGSRLLRRHDLSCQPCTKFGQVPPCPYNFACLNLDDVAPTRVE